MRKIRLGMVGGGQGAFIGEVHRIASRIDDRYELVAGALSSDPQVSAASAAELGIAHDRAYADFHQMASAESEREDGIEVAVIVTPNYLHFGPARVMLQHGIHVICDKPLTAHLEEAEELAMLAKDSGCLFAVTYNYSGYPMVRQAREMIRSGELGAIRLVQVEYPQDWLATDIESDGQKQAVWRTDPSQAGKGGSIGDIGTHAFHLAEFVSGLKVSSLLAELTSFGEGRKLDDNAQILLRYNNGARGSLWASQIAVGHENGLRLRIYGEKGGLEWFQEDPNKLNLSLLNMPKQILTRGGPGVGELANRSSRIPSGHPEGFLEGFANLYKDFSELVIARGNGDDTNIEDTLLPTVADGLRGVRFIETAVASSQAGGIWQDLN
ncbi:MAG: Gfo/Idh/MocA family oxidoreductase [Gammaproteobacteria bacterium]|jgi:predicted dehydrogenase|nr:Gfo/Idh/MocA family oxidoreductase [Gammaproteobacteria bacterium]MBT3858548.1 Gfo/Idh/MocA family oxidoreductase [Gammaproteobacteria bacterium]MBT3986714.1 Gfo/Idh/MocA family oxidoreductase [Gammaproteobacteria bacterium]MBT4582810.1 Gfo/Idh/MocA family oxidoreductase [Gammaproteobacteria bacterium]MBT4657533.1 Gfo/Idh/MocA family oxidoreductase [Gammaproteobacteria bacterium]